MLLADLEDAKAMVRLARSGAFTCQRQIYECMASMLRAAKHPW